MRCLVLALLLSLVSATAIAQVIVGDQGVIQKVPPPPGSYDSVQLWPVHNVNPKFSYSFDGSQMNVVYSCSSLDTNYDTASFDFAIYQHGQFQGSLGGLLYSYAYGIPDTLIRIRPHNPWVDMYFDSSDRLWHGTTSLLFSNGLVDSAVFGPWSLTDTSLHLSATDSSGMALTKVYRAGGERTTQAFTFTSAEGSLTSDIYKSASFLTTVHSSLGDSIYSQSLQFVLHRGELNSKMAIFPPALSFTGTSFEAQSTNISVQLDSRLRRIRFDKLHFPFSWRVLDSNVSRVDLVLSLAGVPYGVYRDTLLVTDTLIDFQGVAHAELRMLPIDAKITLGNEPTFWERCSVPADTNVTQLESDRSGDLYAFGHTLYRSLDEGNTWSNITPGATPVSSLGISPSGLLAAVSGNQVYSSTDFGQQWRVGYSDISVFITGVLGMVHLNPVAVACPDNNEIDVIEYGGGVTHNPNSHFEAVEYLCVSRDTLKKLYEHEQLAAGSNGAYLLAADSSSIYYAIPDSLSAIAFDRKNRLISAYNYRGIDTLGPFGFKINHVSVATTGDIFVATDSGGVFHSNDSGKPFLGLNAGLPALKTSAIAVAPNGRAYVYVPGYGMYRSLVKLQIAGVSEAVASHATQSVIAIDYVAVESDERVQVFDALGRQRACAQSVEGESVRLDVRGLEPGLYFARSAKGVQAFLKLGH